MSNVIFKMTFKHPNLKGTSRKNVSHVSYIATRPDVVKTLTEADLEKELVKGSDEIYLIHNNERPRSRDLFGQYGIDDLVDIQNEIANVRSFVWRCIVSLKEEYAKELGYLTKDKWQDMLRKTMPDMAVKMDVEFTNLRWVGSIHIEKGHPHAHVLMWEREPLKIGGIVNIKTLNAILKIFTDEVFEDERFQLMIERNAWRDLIEDVALDDIADTLDIK